MSTQSQITHHSGEAAATGLFDPVRIRIDQLEFVAQWEFKAAPRTCELFRILLPLHMKMIHCSWSGEGGWIALDSWNLPWYAENQTSTPSPGQLLLYASGQSEPELLIPYGPCVFNSEYGVLTGNHFMTIVEGNERLPDLGRLLLWHGAQNFTLEHVS